jgi:hypothetical protein
MHIEVVGSPVGKIEWGEEGFDPRWPILCVLTQYPLHMQMIGSG